MINQQMGFAQEIDSGDHVVHPPGHHAPKQKKLPIDNDVQSLAFGARLTIISMK